MFREKQTSLAATTIRLLTATVILSFRTQQGSDTRKVFFKNTYLIRQYKTPKQQIFHVHLFFKRYVKYCSFFFLFFNL